MCQILTKVSFLPKISHHAYKIIVAAVLLILTVFNSLFKFCIAVMADKNHESSKEKDKESIPISLSKLDVYKELEAIKDRVSNVTNYKHIAT